MVIPSHTHCVVIQRAAMMCNILVISDSVRHCDDSGLTEN